MSCPFCSTEKSLSTSFPVINFNKKEFKYIRCVKCRLIYLDRFPVTDDYAAMYPPSYQRNGVEAEIHSDPYVKLYGLRYSYGYHFDLIKKFIHNKASILDYGCGTGNFLANAIHYGFSCDGVEFNPEYIKMLGNHFSHSRFYTIDQVMSTCFIGQYDVIRLSNVLEHLVNPLEVIRKLTVHLKPGGIILVEGPIEENFSLAAAFRNFYFRLAKWLSPKRTVSDPPYHVFLSDAFNQRQFFNDCGLEELHYKTSEDAWPFPSSLAQTKGLQGKLTWMIAKISIFFTRLSGKNWGNIFIYCGRSAGK